MNRIIPTRVHGMMDYILGVLLLLVPNLFGFAELDGPAVAIPRMLGVAILIIGALTNHELGIIKVIPMRVHLIIDVLSGLFLAASPFLFGFSDNPANVWLPHVIAGLGYFIVALMTRTEPENAPSQVRATR